MLDATGSSFQPNRETPEGTRGQRIEFGHLIYSFRRESSTVFDKSCLRYMLHTSLSGDILFKAQIHLLNTFNEESISRAKS